MNPDKTEDDLFHHRNHHDLGPNSPSLQIVSQSAHDNNLNDPPFSFLKDHVLSFPIIC